MRPTDKINKLIRELRVNASAELDKKVRGEIAVVLAKSGETISAGKRPVVWRTIMKSPITKLAAAAVIIAAAFIALYPFAGGTPTFGQVIMPILNAQTAIFDIVIGDEESSTPVIHDMVMGSRIRRTLSNTPGIVSIIDLESSKILVLTESTKEAVYIDLKGLPSIPNYMERLRNIITGLQKHPQFVVEELGQQEIAGQKLIGFRAKHPKVEITIWADPVTALPVRIEQVEGQMKVVCKNIQFDAPMEDALFSMDVPEGYTQQQTQLDLQSATEADFIEGLRIRAELFGDGQFPDSVSVEDFIKQAPTIGKKIEGLSLSEKEQIELGMKLQQHLLFIRFFKGEGNWHYAGKGVKLGEADKAIFWYQPKGSQTYRVIYGDLSVKDVTPEDLPK
jgi:outer membrane lipoprotein-sorting protein